MTDADADRGKGKEREVRTFLCETFTRFRYKNLAPNEAIKGPLTDKLAPEDSSLFPDAHPFSPILGLSAGKDLFCKVGAGMRGYMGC